MRAEGRGGKLYTCTTLNDERENYPFKACDHWSDLNQHEKGSHSAPLKHCDSMKLGGRFDHTVFWRTKDIK